MKTFLLEIGCEDLPSWTGETFRAQFVPAFIAALEAKKLSCVSCDLFYTCRRITLCARGIPLSTPAETKKVSGPRIDPSLESSFRTLPQAVHFAKAHGVSPEKLFLEEAHGKKIVSLVKKVRSIPSVKLLPDIVFEAISSLEIPRAMRWDGSDFTFFRPVRWLLALWDSRLLPLSFGYVSSARWTFGHPFLSSGKLKVRGCEDYFNQIRKGSVILDPGERSGKIRDLCESLLNPEETVLEEAREAVVNLVEYPAAIRCDLPSDAKKIPSPVLEIVIANAKGIPLRKNGGLGDQFLIITDGCNTSLCRENYQRLIHTRILDAEFFYKTDLAKPFHSFEEKLGAILFHPKWGSVADRVLRLRTLASYFAKRFFSDSLLQDVLCRSAAICKHDLASEMVREFPVLHGTMGSLYATAAGEPPEVSLPLSGYMKPRSLGDSLPSDPVAIALGIIDRIEYLSAFFADESSPLSSSEDPYGLRRVANTLFMLLQQSGNRVDLTDLSREALTLFGLSEGDPAFLRQESFLLHRLDAFFASEEIPRGLRQAVLSVEHLNVSGARRKIEALTHFISNAVSPETIFLPFTRIANILKQAQTSGYQKEPFNLAYMIEKEEKDLLETYQKSSDRMKEVLSVEDFSSFLEILFQLKDPIDRFFDKVLVMTPDLTVQKNRLSLLSLFNDLFLKFADFSFIREEDVRNVTQR